MQLHTIIACFRSGTGDTHVAMVRADIHIAPLATTLLVLVVATLVADAARPPPNGTWM